MDLVLGKGWKPQLITWGTERRGVVFWFSNKTPKPCCFYFQMHPASIALQSSFVLSMNCQFICLQLQPLGCCSDVGIRWLFIGFLMAALLDQRGEFLKVRLTGKATCSVIEAGGRERDGWSIICIHLFRSAPGKESPVPLCWRNWCLEEISTKKKEVLSPRDCECAGLWNFQEPSPTFDFYRRNSNSETRKTFPRKWPYDKFIV